ncbi:hypothetical protein ACFW9V_22805 [Streptomyces hygroscopicus]|uniref:hypothetical protein n=1 Tax=Streptomyces hygroscopicus TaxID=1912 RepID=UPI0036798D9D
MLVIGSGRARGDELVIRPAVEPAQGDGRPIRVKDIGSGEVHAWGERAGVVVGAGPAQADYAMVVDDVREEPGEALAVLLDSALTAGPA